MVSNKIKRCLSLVMALALTFSLLPLGAMAEEAGDTQSADGTATAAETASETTVSVEEPTTEPTKDAESNPALDSIQAKMNGILEYYLGTPDLTAEEVPTLVAGLNPYDTAAAEMEIYELEYSDEFQSLSEADIQQLTESNASFMAFAEAVSQKASHEKAISTYATTVNVLDGQVTVTDSVGNGSESNGTVTIQAKGGYLSQTTNNITITNKSGSTATVSFDYAASNYSSFSEASASGTKSVILENEGTITMSIKGKKAISSNTATLKLSNFGIETVKEASNVTFNFDPNCGTVTAAGNAITSGDEIEVSLSEGVALVATPINGATFYGWVDAETGVIKSTEASYTLTTGNDLVVEAVFVGTSSSKGYWSVTGATEKTFKNGFLSLTSNTYYQVSTTPSYLFDDLKKAASCAASSSSKYIVPLNNCTLAADDYEIPSGVTLLIPFDDSNTLYTTTAQAVADFTKPSAYRTLNLAEGANLTVNGALSISGKHHYTTASSYHGSSPSGKVGFVNMAKGSSITVNGSLYAYGYITGSGTVTANNGAKVYELFQIADFRGGSQTTKMEKKVFPLSQYYIQNIEVPLVLKYGATEYCYTTIYMSNTEFGSAPVLIGKGEGMFAMGSGSVVTKQYNGSADRLCVEINGTLSLDSVSLTMNNVPVNSADFVLPINNNISVTIKSGSTVALSNDIAMLPGSQVIVEQGASVSLASGKSLYIYDADQWGTFCGSANKTYMPLTYVPGRTYNRQASDIVDAMLQVDGTMDMSAGNFYTTAGINVLADGPVTDWTGGGANICSTGTGQVTVKAVDNTNTYQLVQGTAAGQGYYMIPVTSAQLKNADGSFVATANGGTNTYTYSNGRWCCETHDWGEEGDRICDICGLIKIYGTSVKAGDALDIFFYVEPEDFPNYESGAYTAKIFRTKLAMDSSKKYTVNDPQEEDIPSSQWVSNQDHLRFCYDGIAAKEMTDIVTVKIVDSTGKQVSQTITESIEGYATRALQKLENTNGLHTTLVDMLNYGALAQQYFGYRADNLANANLTDEQKALATQSVSYKEDITYNQNATYPLAAASVTAGNYLHMTFYFSNITDLSGFTAEISYTDHYGTVKGSQDNPIIINGSAFSKGTTKDNKVYYGPTVKNLAIADGREPITCVLKKDGTIIDTVTSSVESYVAATINNPENSGNTVLIELCENLLKFTDSAHSYFHPDP